MKCRRCWQPATDFTGPHCNQCYEELVADVEQTMLELQELTIEIPARLFVTDLTCALFTRLKAKPATFSFVMRPFTLEALKQLRRQLLLEHDVTLSPPRQTKGSRGGERKQWEMTINDTDSFERIVGAEWPQESVVSCGTGRMFSRDSLNGWIPPDRCTSL